jgi:DnaJ-class molecular chaperone
MVAIRKCMKCGGSGHVLEAIAGALEPVKCPRCGGDGRMVLNPPRSRAVNEPQEPKKQPRLL